MKKNKIVKKTLRKILKSKIVTTMISNLIYYYSLLVGKTNKWELKGVDEFNKFWEHDNFILIIWHGRALMPTYFWNKKRPLDALVSLHQDGRLIAGFLKKYGVGIVSGSSTENARGAAVGLMHSVNDNKSICIIPDGPRGPRMRMNMSPIYFAQKSGKPIFGFTYSVKNSKIIEKAWDKMMIPGLFSEGICIVSNPIYIPKDANTEELEQYRLKIENIMNDMNLEADNKMDIQPILPAEKEKQKRYKTKD